MAPPLPTEVSVVEAAEVALLEAEPVARYSIKTSKASYPNRKDRPSGTAEKRLSLERFCRCFQVRLVVDKKLIYYFILGPNKTLVLLNSILTRNRQTDGPNDRHHLDVSEKQGFIFCF